MKAHVPALTPLLRSNAQGNLLALLFLSPESEFSLSDIVRRIGALPATVHREVERLVGAGILLDRMVGRSRLVRVNTSHELYKALSDLLLVSYGPRFVLEPLVAELRGVDEAYIYGSWAARYAGELGSAPRDLDVLIVGSTSRDELNSMARTAEGVLHREVNITRVSSKEWGSAETPFVATLKSRPLVSIAEPVVTA